MRTLLTLSVAATMAAACSRGPEDAILTRFFAAARLHDETALGSFATADFDPRGQGIVTSFTITAISSEQRRPLTLKALASNGDATLAAEEDLVELSAVAPGEALDLARYDGDVVSTEVTITAPVKLPSGETVTKALVITLQRAEMKGAPPILGRWVVTKIEERGAFGAQSRS